MRVAKDKVVTIEYRMMDAAGNLMGTSDHVEPLSFIQGRAMVFPAVEHQVDGRSVGERIVFTLQPNQAFGERNEDLTRQVPRDRFLHHGELKSGMTFTSRGPDHRRLVTIVEVTEDEIRVDENHPLAGQTLQIDVVIVDVRVALDDELANGVIQEIADIYAREKEAIRINGVQVKGPTTS